MSDRNQSSRRRFLALSATTATALAGCTGDSGEQETTTEGQGGTTTPSDDLGLESFQGSGPYSDGRPDLSGPRIEDLPDLSGTLDVYLGGGEGGLYRNLLDRFRNIYSDFDPKVRSAPTSQLANTIVEESSGGSSPADVFWAVDAGSLAYVANQDVATQLPSEV